MDQISVKMIFPEPAPQTNLDMITSAACTTLKITSLGGHFGPISATPSRLEVAKTVEPKKDRCRAKSMTFVYRMQTYLAIASEPTGAK